ncbi:MAG TPA: hypothetical protein VKA26_14710 [Ignavibacteriaceae bacterium]|nr:hypothetical protein [Ignavibacteriaceae bacterium]
MKTIEIMIERWSSKNILIKLYKYYFIDSIIIAKREGFKSLLKKRGWKVFAIVVGYYAVRDSIVYLLIPYLITNNLI